MTDSLPPRPAPHAAPRPLEGLRVLDLSRVLAGPYCAAILADFGAETTKIEIPGRGDDSRAFAPFLQGDSSYFMLVNRGKKSVTMDLKSEEGLGLLRSLVAQTDILVENFRPGVTRRLGIDYETLHALNPRLIYVSISGFGQTGPMAHRPAYDHIIQAMGGIMSVTGSEESGPTRVGDSVADCVAGLYGALAVFAAVMERATTGCGRHIDVAMLDTMMSLQMVAMSRVSAGQAAPPRVGNAHSGSAPMGSYPARDGTVVIAVANDSLFNRLAHAIGAPELLADPRYVSDAVRVGHRDALDAVISHWTAARSVDEIVDALDRAGIPVSPIWSLADALQSDYAAQRAVTRPVPRADGSLFHVMPQPVLFDGAGSQGDFAAPRLGADTEDILQRDLGLTEAQIAGLRNRGII